jgi:phosphoenolpyruvate-protein kinase (PTS system EI component)
MMCELPSNILLADTFAPYFDGFSIGSNDLTQLVLGVDRDNELLAAEFDERNPAVLRFIAQAITACKRNHLHSSICGQAPSDFPEFAAFLVRQGIDSLSLNADSLLSTLRSVIDAEKALESSPALPSLSGEFTSHPSWDRTAPVQHGADSAGKISGRQNFEEVSGPQMETAG